MDLVKGSSKRPLAQERNSLTRDAEVRMGVVLFQPLPSLHIPKEPTFLPLSVRWSCNRVQGSDFVSKDQVCRDRVCTKHLSRMIRSRRSALGFWEPASRKSSVPACRPDQDGGFVVYDQSQLLWGLGGGAEHGNRCCCSTV